jgi:hypothetical protein
MKKSTLKGIESKVYEEAKQILLNGERVTATKHIMTNLNLGLADAYRKIKAIEADVAKAISEKYK